MTREGVSGRRSKEMKKRRARICVDLLTIL